MHVSVTGESLMSRKTIHNPDQVESKLGRSDRLPTVI
jgi:hypothetical protein